MNRMLGRDLETTSRAKAIVPANRASKAMKVKWAERLIVIMSRLKLRGCRTPPRIMQSQRPFGARTAVPTGRDLLAGSPFME
jgi:hypothetical protein